MFSVIVKRFAAVLLAAVFLLSAAGWQEQGFDWQDVDYTLVLSQPAAQGDGGIWCVERWYDNHGTLYYQFPNDGKTYAEEYYAKLQETADGGEETACLDPVQAAQEFVREHFSHTAATADSLEQVKIGS